MNPRLLQTDDDGDNFERVPAGLLAGKGRALQAALCENEELRRRLAEAEAQRYPLRKRLEAKDHERAA